MWIVKRAEPVAVSLVVVCIITAILWYLKFYAIDARHPVFFYLLPMAIVAIRYGSMPALLCAFTATGCAAFFLYDPIYSFHVASRLEVGDLVCFAVLAVMGVKCTGELLRPSAQRSVQAYEAKSRFGRP